MEKKKVETTRVEMRVPVELIKLIDKYQEEHVISNRTATILELIRKGLSK